MDWMDFNRDGKVDASEKYLGAEMLCTSREEHEALFGDAGNFALDDIEDLDEELDMAGLDCIELEFMDEDERREVLENEGVDLDDFDF